MKYVIVVEKSKTGFGAYAPDLPGCVATARSRAKVISLMREAIEFHIQGMREDGIPVPKPMAQAVMVPMPKVKRVRKAA